MVHLLYLGSDVIRLILQFCPLNVIQKWHQTCSSIRKASQHRVVLQHVTIPVVSLIQFQMLAQSPLYSNLSRIKALKWSDPKKIHFNRQKGYNWTDPIYSTLEGFTNLTELNLANLFLGSSGAHNFARNLPSLPKLTQLDLSNNQIKKAGCDSLHKALTLTPNLTHLNLHNNRINQIGSFASLPLITLNLSENCIDWHKFNPDFWPASLLHLDISLSGIMQGNPCAETGIAIFSRLPPHLITLKLSSCFYQITESLVNDSPLPPTLTQLIILELQGNYYPTPAQRLLIQEHHARHRVLPQHWGQLNKTNQTSTKVEFTQYKLITLPDLQKLHQSFPTKVRIFFSYP